LITSNFQGISGRVAPGRILIFAIRQNPV